MNEKRTIRERNNIGIPSCWKMENENEITEGVRNHTRTKE